MRFIIHRTNAVENGGVCCNIIQVVKLKLRLLHPLIVLHTCFNVTNAYDISTSVCDKVRLIRIRRQTLDMALSIHSL